MQPQHKHETRLNQVDNPLSTLSPRFVLTLLSTECKICIASEFTRLGSEPEQEQVQMKGTGRHSCTTTHDANCILYLYPGSALTAYLKKQILS